MGNTPNEAKLNKKDRVRSFMIDLLIALSAPIVMSLLFYGKTAALLIAVSVLTCVICEFLCSHVILKKNTLKDFSAIVTGVLIAMMLPASAPIWLPITAGVFAILVAKIPFGGVISAPFVPAAAGFAFISICWPNLVYSYPLIDMDVALPFVNSAAQTGQSIASMLHVGQSVSTNFLTYANILIGDVPGPIGTTSIVALFGSAAYLLIRRSRTWIASAGFVAICAFFAVLFPRVLSGRKASLVMEISAGMLVFCALFVLTDLASCPRTPLHRLYYGMGAGLLCMLLRYFGPYEEGACFAILLMNGFWPALYATIQRYSKKTVLKTNNSEQEVPSNG